MNGGQLAAMIRFGLVIVTTVFACGNIRTLDAQQTTLRVTVRDDVTGKPLPSRLYLSNDQGQFFYFGTEGAGTAVRYDKQNWFNKNAIERHTTVVGGPAVTRIPPGTYTLSAHHGKTYFPMHQTLDVSADDVDVELKLKRWIDMASRGWYSGDMHLHRPIDEMKNVMLAEDLNVVFPLTQWVTFADRLPAAGDKNTEIETPARLMEVDPHHVIWPLNTEYEIFSIGGKRHTLGALFVLGHREPLAHSVPPWKPVITAARRADPESIFDMDKLSWPFAMTLPPLVPDATYELINNHLWRTEFGFREWYTEAAPYMQPPFGGTEGGERQWIDFSLGMYYTLLDCGFRLPPSAGTANGVHPVPAGFGRVYVHLADGFDYQAWREALRRGRSFVTTGPMLFATADGHHPGHQFKFQSEPAEPPQIPLQIEVISERPISFGELLVNGKPEILLRVQNQKTDTGAYRSVLNQVVTPTRSGWFAVRFWEDREGSRVRFAHSAPWYVEVDDQPVKPRREEKAYLVRRMNDEIERSRGVVSQEAMAEYERVLEFYSQLPVADDSDWIERNSRPLLTRADRERWLGNMIIDHRFSLDEVRRATGMSIEEARRAIDEMRPSTESNTDRGQITILPYPGGRHPRRGFLDGAIDPQRDTKVSIFPPWKDGGYAVVDVPEAIFSNLGLTYLAHQHIPTIWTDQEVEMQPLEWEEQGGALVHTRRLPNGIDFTSHVRNQGDVVAMEMILVNGTDEPLTGLRSQVCVMLKGLIGFNAQRRRTELTRPPFVAVKADAEDRWIITAWEPNNRVWTNPPVPCIHSDPIFPDCPPGETVTVRGGLWFYEGSDVEAEIERLSIPAR